MRKIRTPTNSYSLNLFHYQHLLREILHIVHPFSEDTQDSKCQITSDVHWRPLSQHNLEHIKALVPTIIIFHILSAGQEPHRFATQTKYIYIYICNIKK